ncbi:RNA methyltransferase [Bartonella acomydis]|uniref:Uncharacterized protein n=1 Tax=Bartonella acomydis TaxID=686234 RepID=A0ABP9MLB2_9HYPH
MLLCGISNHDNMGNIFPNAAAICKEMVFPLTKLHVIQLYRKSIRVSTGAALKADIHDIITTINAPDFHLYALFASAPYIILKQAQPTRSIALILRTEDDELPTQCIKNINITQPYGSWL